MHRHTFDLSALPRLIAYAEQTTTETKEALGRELLRQLPQHIGEQAVSVLTGHKASSSSKWVVFRELHTATRSATSILEGMLGLGGADVEPLPSRPSRADPTIEPF